MEFDDRKAREAGIYRAVMEQTYPHPSRPEDMFIHGARFQYGKDWELLAIALEALDQIIGSCDSDRSRELAAKALDQIALKTSD